MPSPGVESLRGRGCDATQPKSKQPSPETRIFIETLKRCQTLKPTKPTSILTLSQL
jgi:hypothetical protein